MKNLALVIGCFCLMAGTAAFAHSSSMLNDGEFDNQQPNSATLDNQQLPPGQPFGPGMQPGQGPERPFENITPEEAAEKLTAEMTEVLDLTDKQIKKVTKFNKKDQEELKSLYSSRFGGASGPGGFGGPGMGGPGGRPGGMPGGPGGRPGGMPGGGQGGPGMRPEGMPMMTPDLSDLEAYWTKKEKKLRKILDEEQFDKWYALHPEQFGVREERPAPFGDPQDGEPPFLTPQGQTGL